MDYRERIKRQNASFCMLTFIIDENRMNKGDLLMNTSTIKRAYRDEQDIYMADLVDGTSICPIDMDLEALETAIMEWRDKNPEEFEYILSVMKQRIS